MRAWTRMTMVASFSLVGCVRAWSPAIECETDADCADGQRCLAIEYEADDYYGDVSLYQSGTYQFACTTRQRCGPGDGGCRQGEICDLDSQGGVCVAPECTATDVSACGGYGCDPETYRCLNYCADYSYLACAAGHYCLDETCHEFECGGNPREVCIGYACVEGACLASCGSDGDCVAGYSCIGGVCRGGGTDGDSCGLHLDCAETHFCDGYSCQLLREDSASCSSHEQCLSGSCLENYFYGAYFCASAVSTCSAACSTSQYCDETTGACAPRRSGGAACEFGEECVTDECLSDGLCATGYGDDCSAVDCASAFTCTYEYDYYEGDLYFCK